MTTFFGYKNNSMEDAMTNHNVDKIVISLYDYTGEALKPWAEAGYHCFAYDIQHDEPFDRCTNVESFDSGYFNGPGPTFSYTFNTPGVTTYICDPHPNSMYGAVTVTGTASVQEESKFNFRISPNPASNIINLSFDNIVNEDITIEIYDLLGRMNRSVISNIKNGTINLVGGCLNSAATHTLRMVNTSTFDEELFDIFNMVNV